MSVDAIYAPVLPGERWRSIDMYRENYEEFIPRWFPEREVVSALPGGGVDDSGWKKRWQRDIAYPLKLRTMGRKYKGVPLHVFDHSYSHLAGHWSPTVVHCRDLNHLVLPSLTGLQLTLWKQRLKVLERADIVIAISHQLASEIVEHTAVPEERIRVIYHGIDVERFCPSGGEAAAHEFSDLAEASKDQFLILNIGTNIARKNLDTIYRAVVRLRAAGVPATLVRVGTNDGFGRDEEASMAEAGVKDYVMQLGRRSAHEVAQICKLCHCLSFASMYEGFGRPLLEAQASDLPLVAANASCIPEIAGKDGALYHSAEDVDELVAQFTKVLDGHPDVATALEGGRANLSRFHWKKHLQSIFDVYAELS